MQDNQLTRLSHYINTGFPCEKKNLPIDLQDYWNYWETLSLKLNTIHMITIQHLMSEHCYDSISNKSTRPEENTTQKKYRTRLLDHNNIDLPCDKESSPADLPESWSHKELLYNRPKLINKEQIIPMTHKEVYLLSRPLKTMAHQYRHTEKEVHLLSGPSALHPVIGYTTATHCTHKEFCFLPGPSKNKKDPDCCTKQTLVQHRQNTSWEPAIVASQSSSNSYWIMQENGSDQPKVYRRTRNMLKIRCTDIQNPTPEYSHLTENQKAKFHSPYISNEERNLVRHNSVNKVPSDLVTQTKLSTASVSDSVFSERKEETTKIAEIAEDAPAEEKNLHLHLHWRQSKNDHTLQEQGSQHERTLGNQPVHIVTFTCKTLS